MVSERKLWAAVLAQAIIDSKRDCALYETRGLGQRHKVNRDSANYWLYESERHGIGSLIWICDELGLSVSFVREYVTCWNGNKFSTFDY
jgi:hypothetical protein